MRGKFVVVKINQFSGGVRVFQRVRHDNGNRFAHKTHLAGRQDWAGRSGGWSRRVIG